MIATSPRLSSDRLLIYARLLILAMAVAWFVSLAAAFLFFWKGEAPVEGKMKREGKKAEKQKWDYEQIGGGPLALNAHAYSPFIARLSEALIVVGKNSRPDQQERATLIVGIRGEGEKKELRVGESFFIETTPQRVCFSSTPTSCMVRTRFNENRQVVFETEGKEEAHFLTDEEALSDSSAPYVKTLLEGKIWGADSFLKMYGGEEERALSGKQKIEFTAGGFSSVCFVSAGDYLSWNGSGWEVVNLEKALPQAPLAHIKAVSPEEIEISLWDETGFYQKEIKIQRRAENKGEKKAETLIASARLRSNTQVSCMMEKRRVLLKVGDWVLKTPSGWHILRSAQEIDDYLYHRIRGQLFVFDSLEKEGGSMVIRGHLFDEMRTRAESLSIPLSQEKKQPSAVRKRKIKDLP